MFHLIPPGLRNAPAPELLGIPVSNNLRGYHFSCDFQSLHRRILVDANPYAMAYYLYNTDREDARDENPIE